MYGLFLTDPSRQGLKNIFPLNPLKGIGRAFRNHKFEPLIFTHLFGPTALQRLRTDFLESFFKPKRGRQAKNLLSNLLDDRRIVLSEVVLGA